MRFVLASVLAAHGIAHFVGVVSSWQLATLAELPYKTTIFAGHLDVGDLGMRVIGGLWLLAALAFLAGAIAVALGTDWSGRVIRAAVLGSTLLCLAGWPDSRLGLAVNVGLALVLTVAARLNLAELAN